MMPTASPTATYVMDTTPATAVGFNSSSTLNGAYTNFPAGTIVSWYNWAPCDTYNVSTTQTPNATFISTGAGSTPGYVLTGLSADVLYCYQSCGVSPSTKPDTAVCGDIESFQWTTAVCERVGGGREPCENGSIGRAWCVPINQSIIAPDHTNRSLHTTQDVFAITATDVTPYNATLGGKRGFGVRAKRTRHGSILLTNHRRARTTFYYAQATMRT